MDFWRFCSEQKTKVVPTECRVSIEPSVIMAVVIAGIREALAES